MPTPVARYPYQGVELPTGATTVVLYDSTLNTPEDTDKGAQRLHGAGIRWAAYAIWHDQDATVNGFFKTKKQDGTLSPWRLFYTQAITGAAVASADEVYIETFEHVKFEMLNGGITQTAFEPNFILSDQRAKAS